MGGKISNSAASISQISDSAFSMHSLAMKLRSSTKYFVGVDFVRGTYPQLQVSAALQRRAILPIFWYLRRILTVFSAYFFLVSCPSGVFLRETILLCLHDRCGVNRSGISVLRRVLRRTLYPWSLYVLA